VANFQQHLQIASFPVGVGPALALAWGVVAPLEALCAGLLGLFGGVAPDLDSDNSVICGGTFFIISIGVSLFTMNLFADRLEPKWLMMVWALSFIALQIVLEQVVKPITVHRGMWHSVPAGIGGAALLVNCANVYDVPFTACLVLGGNFLLGYLTHLVADERYSINLDNRKIKKSLGTAVKFWYNKAPVASAGVWIFMVANLILIPWWKLQ